MGPFSYARNVSNWPVAANQELCISEIYVAGNGNSVPYSDYLRRSPDAVKRNPGLAFPDSTALHPGYIVYLE